MSVNSKLLIIGAASLAAALGTYLYQKKKKEIIPWKWVEIGEVARINLFPLKSGHRIELTEAEATQFGIKMTSKDENANQLRDRCLVIYGARDYEFRTARTYPKIMLIDVSVHDDEHIALDTATMRTLYVKIPNKKENKCVTITLHKGEEIQAIDCGDEAATWISRFILEKDSGFRLGYYDASCKRNVEKILNRPFRSYYKDFTNNSAGLYSDLSAVLVVNQASVKELNSRIGNSSITVDHFRPNIVVDGENVKPFDEDKWKWLKIGDQVVLKNVKDCTRCVMTTINPENGVRNSDREPLRTLEQFRVSPGPEKSAIMGINCGTRRNGTFKIRDKVYIPVNNK